MKINSPFKLLPVIWQDSEYDYINEFDCHIVDLGYKEGGSYFTCIPISCLEYRKTSKKKCQQVVIKNNDKYVEFHIRDDWDILYIMKIPFYMRDKIEIAKQAAIQQELLKTK